MIDERGFTISRGANKYLWNGNGQLIGVMLKEGKNDITINYHYNHKNRLMSRFVTSGSNNQNRTQFIYDQVHPKSISHCVIDSRIIGFTYDTNGHLIALTIEGTKYYVASDHLGSPVAVYTGDGVLVKEIVRNVWGKILKDSNPSFWLPIDFHGSIRDPLTGLNHFEDGRVYDSSIAQWLTPNWDTFDHDLLDMAHLYRFRNNDPVNPVGFLRKFDGDLTKLPMANIESWLETLGFRFDYIFDQNIHPKIDQSSKINLVHRSPILTLLNTETKNLVSIFNQLSMIPESKIKLPFNSNPEQILTINEKSIAILPSTLNGVLISRTPRITTVHSVEIDKNPMINAVLTHVFNETYSLPFHLVHHSRDEFFFVNQPTNTKTNMIQLMQRDIDQLHKLGSLVNVSRITDSEQTASTSANHLLISTGNLLLNIRYGGTINEEFNRVARLARRKAIQEAWQREIFYLRHSSPGLAKMDWSAEERKTLLHSGQVREYFGSDIHGVEVYPQLADDPTNVRFKRDANVLSRKRRNHSHRSKLIEY